MATVCVLVCYCMANAKITACMLRGLGSCGHHFHAGQDGDSPEGAGEGVRLKLQTPLFVADALMGAAGQRLAAEVEAARVSAASNRKELYS